MSIELVQRNATLADMAKRLETLEDVKHDAVVPATAIRSVGGTLRVEGMGPDGPVGEAGLFQPTRIMDGHLATRLGVPLDYLRRLREGKIGKDGQPASPKRLDLYDANVNGWLHGVNGGDPSVVIDGAPTIDPDNRKFLLRTFTDPEGGVGIARALTSDRYGVIDHLDMVTAVFAGIRESGINIDVQSCDLTESRMTVKISAPELSVLAPELLKGYRSPFSGNEGADNPTVFAGLCFSNSETGGGAYTIVPRFIFQICTNGMTIKRDALREVHLGSKLDEGVIKWTGETHRQNLELVTAKTKDAVTTFLDTDYMEMVLDRITERAGKPIAEPAKAVELIGTQLRFTEEQRTGILDHFIKGGQVTAGGVLQAVTSYAQTVSDPDEAYDLELAAMDAFDLAAA